MATQSGHSHAAAGGSDHGGHGHGGHGSVLADRTPAFVGLLGGGALLGGILYAVVVWTNTQFEGHKREIAKAEPAAGGPAAAGAAALPAAGAPAGAGGGTEHTVRMLGDASGYRFEPATLTIKAGDAVKWVNVSGGPHNAAFDPAQVPDDVEAVLSKNMPEQMAALQGKLLVNPNEEYRVSFAGIKPGAYNYVCAPHAAMNMKGTITVQ